MQNLISVVSSHLERPAISDTCRLARELEFDCVEWIDPDGTFLTGKNIQAITRCSRHCGLKTAYHAPYLPPWNIAMYPAKRLESALRKLLGTARQLSAGHMTLHLGSLAPGVPRTEALRRIARGIKQAAGIAEDYGINIGIENSTACFNAIEIGTRIEDFKHLFGGIASPAVGLTLDTGHGNVTGTLPALLKQFGGRIANIHLHDNNGVSDDHIAPGHGSIRWDAFFRTISALKYRRMFTLEFHESSGEFPAFISQLRSRT